MDDHQINYIKKHSWKTIVAKFEIYKLMSGNSHIFVRTNGFGFLVELEELTSSFKIKKGGMRTSQGIEIHVF